MSALSNPSGAVPTGPQPTKCAVPLAVKPIVGETANFVKLVFGIVLESISAFAWNDTPHAWLAFKMAYQTVQPQLKLERRSRWMLRSPRALQIALMLSVQRS